MFEVDGQRKEFRMEPRYTQAAYDTLVQEREKAKRRLDAALQALGEAAGQSNNTWHDNPAFDAANDEIKLSQAALASVEERLRGAVVVDKPTGDQIDIGHTVTLKTPEGSIERFHIAGHSTRMSAEDEEITNISTGSPLGTALLHHTRGDTISYEGPTGLRMTYYVVSVD